MSLQEKTVRSVRGRCVLITGASRGLGQVLAEQCIARGASRVWATSRGTGLPDLEDPHRAAKHLELDVTCEESIARAADVVEQVDVLINNAAVCTIGSALDLDMDQLKMELEVNYWGPLRVIRAFRPQLEASRGLIVNIASQLVHTAAPVIGNYSASKSALLALSQAVSGDLRQAGVGCLTVCPGAIDTDMSRPFPSVKQDVQEAAGEILDAVEAARQGVLPIGEQARQLFATFRLDPEKAIEKKASMTVLSVFGPNGAG